MKIHHIKNLEVVTEFNDQNGNVTKKTSMEYRFLLRLCVFCRHKYASLEGARNSLTEMSCKKRETVQLGPLNTSWIKNWTSKWMHEWMDEWMNEWMQELINLSVVIPKPHDRIIWNRIISDLSQKVHSNLKFKFKFKIVYCFLLTVLVIHTFNLFSSTTTSIHNS